jgi:hypothetical protein
MSLPAVLSSGWAKLAVTGVFLTIPFAGNLFANTDVRLGVSYQGEVPGLRFRNEPGSLFKRSATIFETELGRDTATVLGDTTEFLEERFGIETTCPLVPVVDVFRSDFLTGNIVITDGAWALYTAADLEGGPCPATTLEPRQPSFYLETILQRGTYRVDLEVAQIRLPFEPNVKIVQVLVLPAKPGIELGGTYAAEHGSYTLVPISPADLTVPFDDILFGYMRLSWGNSLREDIQIESIEPNSTSPAGYKSQTLLFSSPTFGTGIYVADYAAMAVSWDADPELTGNPVLGIPRNPILTPRRVNFRYQGRARFPYTPSVGVHAPCVSDFSDPANLRICPPTLPTP